MMWRTLVLAALLPAALSAQVERVIDSARADGLPVEPLLAKAAEGRLKQASDAQIVVAVRSLANRFRSIRAEMGTTLDVPTMTAAATALGVGIPMRAIVEMRDAARGSSTSNADLAGALVTATDLVAQRVSPVSAVTAVQSLLVRRASPEQFAHLRTGVGETIAAGRSPDQAARSASESIVKGLPPAPPSVTTIKPPVIGMTVGDGLSNAQVSSAPSTSRNSR